MLEICYTLDGKTIYARWDEQGDEERAERNGPRIDGLFVVVRLLCVCHCGEWV